MPGCEPGEFIVTCLWNSLLVHPLINLLVLADYFVHDFGLAVVIVTVAIRLALFPVFRALFAMYAAFQQVGGLTGAHALTIQELRDKVLWPFLPTPPELEPDATIDLTAHWLPWISNLAKPDHVVILPLIGGIGPLPIISAALQLVASIQALPRKPAQTDDPTQRTMQSMTYYLPLITIVFFKDLAAGVFIYYITTKIFQIIQQYFVMGWGQLPRFIPALDNIPTPADATMRARESAAIKEAEDDMKSA